MNDTTLEIVRPGEMSRRQFIKSIIATGAVSSSGILFSGTAGAGSKTAPGSVERLITLNVNG